jgi:SsrA-binding protein
MIILSNKKAFFDYQILETYKAGIKLFGYEAKALREGRGRLEGSYVVKLREGLFLTNFQIQRYSKISQKIEDSEITRSRQLLLTKREISKIVSEISQKGKSCVPLHLHLDHGLFKIEIAVVKGKKEYERKQTAKEKQEKRDLEKAKKSVGTWG